jgi:phytoene dehydrogenase-like protein
MISATAAVLGEIGLPAPVRELASRRWDMVIVGAGHNGLACAAYLARANKRVLVLESRARVGGACTIEETFPGVRMSPCAYLAGLLHPLVVSELNLPEHGFQWTPAVNGLFVPWFDGSSIQLWEDDDRCDAEIRNFAAGDVQGWRALNAVLRRLPPGHLVGRVTAGRSGLDGVDASRFGDAHAYSSEMELGNYQSRDRIQPVDSR